MTAPSAPPPRRGFVSSVFGDHMVLQRAPQRARLWGFTRSNASVSVSIHASGDRGHKPLRALADADGKWTIALPPVQASAAPHTLHVTSSTTEKATLHDVLFGDVFLCAGQSNMVFSVGAMENGTAELRSADSYPTIRLMTIGQGTRSSTRLDDLQTVEQPWVVASSASVAHGGPFGYFSAVCWIFGREVHALIATSPGAWP